MALFVNLVFLAALLYALYWVVRIAVRHGIGDSGLVRTIRDAFPPPDPDDEEYAEEEPEDEEPEAEEEPWDEGPEEPEPPKGTGNRRR